MKKVMRSPILKGIAFAVCLICVAVAAIKVSNTLEWFNDKAIQRGGNNVYLLESSFEQSQMLNGGFTRAAVILDNALRDMSTQEDVTQLLSQNFVGDYYAKLGDKVLKNVDLTEEQVRQSPYYLIVKPDNILGNITFYGSHMFANWDETYNGYYDYDVDDETKTVTLEQQNAYQPGDCILLRMTDEQVNDLRALWYADREMFLSAIRYTITLALVALAAFVYLLFVTGRRAEDEEVHLVLIDRMFVECNLALICAAAIGTVAIIFVVLDSTLNSGMGFEVITYPLTALLVCAFALVMELILSLVRNLKNRTFIERSFILRAIRWCWRTAKRICRWFIGRCKAVWHGIGRGRDGLWRKAFQDYKTRNALLVFTGYSAVLAIITVLFGMVASDYWYMSNGLTLFTFFVLGVAWVAASACFIFKRIDGFDRVVEAIKRLRGGDLTYKLTDMPAGVFSAMAEDINSLGDGMQAALQNELRAERMKSELITNVSHDLKTPLTSILSYSDLLCQEHLTPEEANDYAKIIHQKSLRLKNLTSDLFDISKVQSGAEQMQCERIDACTLVRQALGEQDKAIAESRLTLKVDIPERELPIWADGKKMSRVMENLIGNCIKYALPGTRVFVSAAEREGQAVIELKNIANYAMDFDPGEITERFVRGDAARSTEGSGLGLAIAKSYVEACGGALAVEVDGDLFKVRITFPVYGAQPA